MPARADIDPLEIPRLLPIVLIADAGAVPARMRLLGTEATEFYGREMRGRSIDAFNLGAFTPAWVKAFDLVTDTRHPTAAVGGYAQGARTCTIEAVLLPLSDQDGKFDLIFGGLHIRPVFWDRQPVRRPVIQVLPLLDQQVNCAVARGGIAG